MKKTVILTLGIALLSTMLSCKKTSSSSVGSSLTYHSSNDFVLSPNSNSSDSLKSIIYLEKIDLLCDIEDKRVSETNYSEGYELIESSIQSIRPLSFKMEEKNANTEHESLSLSLEKSVLEIYHGQYENIQVIGTCTTVKEVGLSYDRLTFDLDQQSLTSYIDSYPDYKFRVVNTFKDQPKEPRFFRYEFDLHYSAEFIYKEE